MCIITVSGGLFSGARELAQGVAQRLGYRCIGHKAILDKAVARGVPQRSLREVLEKAPRALDPLGDKKQRVLLGMLEVVLREEVRGGRIVYYGMAGHLLLRGLPGIFHVQVVAPLRARIEAARDSAHFSEGDAADYIRKADRERQKWVRSLYGVESDDSSLYDLSMNLEKVQLEQAAAMIAEVAGQNYFQSAVQTLPRTEDLALLARESSASQTLPRQVSS